jgi:hypothetical protein
VRRIVRQRIVQTVSTYRLHACYILFARQILRRSDKEEEKNGLSTFQWSCSRERAATYVGFEVLNVVAPALTLVSCLVYSWTLKIEAICSSET